ncbi:hypothetical protein D1007_53215 [Hordeum vulgare]|nr:hypothetical protein D1007_53215 [Hordeum vulgare]
MRIVVTTAGADSSSRGHVVSMGHVRAAPSNHGSLGGALPLQRHAGIHAREKVHEFIMVNLAGTRAGCDSSAILRGPLKAAYPVACGSERMVAAMDSCG